MRRLVADLRSRLAAIEEGRQEAPSFAAREIVAARTVRLLDPRAPFPGQAAAGVTSAAILAASSASARERSQAIWRRRRIAAEPST
jgi:precorrin-6x reductase